MTRQMSKGKCSFCNGTFSKATMTKHLKSCPQKKIVVSFGLMPKTMTGKKILKKIVFGNLVKMPREINSNTAEYEEPIKISPLPKVWKSPNFSPL